MTENSDRPDANAGTEHSDPGVSGSPGSAPTHGSWGEPSEPAPAPERPGVPADPVPWAGGTHDADIPPLPPPDVPGPGQPFAEPPPYGIPAAYPDPQAGTGWNAIPDYGTPTPSRKVVHGPHPSYQPEYGTPEYAASRQAVPVYVPVPTPVPPPADSTTTAAATILLVVSVLSLFSCFFTLAGLIGMVIAIVALALNRSNPAAAKRLAIGGWIAFAGISLLLALFFGLAAVLG